MALRVLRLNGDAFFVNGDRLVFGVDAVTPATSDRQPGGWLPVIYLDKQGKPVGLNEVKEQALEAVPEAVEAQVEAAIEKIEAQAVDSVAFDVIAAQYRILERLVKEFDDALAMELMARAMEAKRRADDEYDVEILMLSI
jgi:hypothetical protein